jgi:type IV pilus assembly protein PilM
MKQQLFYHRRPLFGLDIGSQTVKFVQLENHAHKAVVKAYGSIATDDEIMKNGVITNIPKAAELVDKLLSENIKGKITTNRVVMSVPVSRAYTRVVDLPLMSKKELESAVKLEIEQSIPVPTKNLYYDYEVMPGLDNDNLLVRMVATQKEIIDSYVAVCDLLGLDLALVQTNIRADAQLCIMYENMIKGSPYVIVDVGGDSIDIGILDETLRVTGTVEEGGNSLTDAIARVLHITHDKAHKIKITKGIAAGAQQAKIKSAVDPILDKVVVEIQRMIKFYEERVHEGAEVSQILIVGGGANMPGLGDYLTNATHIATRVSSPWGKYLEFGHIEPPENADLPRFLTCIGLALAKDEDIAGL